jgi:hypothetical protein
VAGKIHDLAPRVSTHRCAAILYRTRAIINSWGHITTLVFLFVAFFGFGGVCDSLLEGAGGTGWGRVLFAMGFIPFFLYFTLTFCNALPPVGISGLRAWVIIVMVWYSSQTLLAETLIIFSLISAPYKPFGIALVFRICMHAGWLSFVPLMRTYHAIGRLDQDRRNIYGTPSDDVNRKAP